MSDLSKFGSDLINAVIDVIHGKPPSVPLNADAQKLLGDAQSINAGIVAVAPDVPGLVADVVALVAEGTALAASQGLSLPALAAAGTTLQKTVADFAKAQADLLAGIANYKTAVAVVASATPAGTVGKV